MNVSRLMASRRAIHHFQPGFKISDKDFLALLESVKHTPSGYNAQPWEFLLIREETRLKKIQEIALGQPHVTQAGNMVIVLGDRDFGKNESERILTEWTRYKNLPPHKIQGLKSSLLKEREDWKKREMVIRNASLAAMTFLLAAEDLGFATCPMMGFRQLELKRFLELPEPILPVLMIALGKADKQNPEPDPFPRKDPKDFGMKEVYGGRF